MRRCNLLILVVLAALAFHVNLLAQNDGNFAVAIETNLPSPANPVGVDTILHLSNSGASWGSVLPTPTGAPTVFAYSFNPFILPVALASPGVVTASGTICANVYVFSPDEQEQACCSCQMSPNSLSSYTSNDLIGNSLTGAWSTSVAVKVIASALGGGITACDPRFPGVVASAGNGATWYGPPVAPGLVLAIKSKDVEVPVRSASLSQAELARAVRLCSNIYDNGNGHGKCAACRVAGQCVPTVPPPIVLPPGKLTQHTTPSVTVTHDVNTLTETDFHATFAGVPPGESILNQTYLAWCVDIFGPFGDNTDTTAYQLFSTLNNSALPLNAQNAHWPMINWVLNNKSFVAGSPAPTWAIQQTIWRLLFGQYAPPGYPLPQPETDNFYNAALTHGSFVPGAGQTTAILLYVDGIYPDMPTGTLPGNGQPNVAQEVLIEIPVPPSCI